MCWLLVPVSGADSPAGSRARGKPARFTQTGKPRRELGIGPPGWRVGDGRKAGWNPASEGGAGGVGLPGGVCAARASRRRKAARPCGIAASSATSPMPSGRFTIAALRPSKPPSRSAASRPASSRSKARKTRGQPRREAAAFSTPWVPRAAQAGRPHPARESQSNRPSARTAQDGAGPSLPSPSTGLGPGSDWNRGAASGSMARPASQRTRPPEASGTTTIPANRSEPRSMNSPESLSRPAVKPEDPRNSRRPFPGA